MFLHNEKELLAAVKKCMAYPAVAVDTETTAYPTEQNKGLKALALVLHAARITVVTFANEGGTYCVVSDQLDEERGVPLSRIIAAVKPMMESQTITKVFHNANYDVNVFANHGVVCRNVLCTMLAGSLQDANLPKSLKERACQVGMFLHQMKTLSDLDEFYEYATEDAEATFRLHQAYMYGRSLTDEYDGSALKMERWQRHFLFKQELPVLQVCIKAERRGIRLDKPYILDLEKRLLHERNEAKKEILGYAKAPFNINSSTAISKFLFEDLGLPVVRVSDKTGKPSADKMAIDMLQNAHPVVKTIQKARLCDKLLSNYASGATGLLAYADSEGVLHATINSNAAVTGRGSVQFPPMQTLPREDTIKKLLGEGFSIRRALIPRSSDYCFVGRDLSQIEIRMTAIYSEDPRMIEVYTHDCEAEGCRERLKPGEKCILGDIHSMTARACRINRQPAKNVNFGFIYGMGPRKLREGLKLEGIEITEEESKRIYDTYHRTYTGIKSFHETILKEHLRQGYVLLITGRHRTVPNLTSPDKKKSGAARRELANNTIQGSCADLLKQSMIGIAYDKDFSGMGAYLLMQVHDELLAECPATHAEEVNAVMKEYMERIPDGITRPFCVPIQSEGGIGNHFAELK